jgi:DNA-binding MarR family transcriptional regulator
MQDNESTYLTKQDYEELARFRFGIRRYLRFSEDLVRQAGLTPQHYQLLLAIKGFPGREWVTVRELADRLQLRHNSAVELINRAQKQGLVHRTADPSDGRAVRVTLPPRGQDVFVGLGALHHAEFRRMRVTLNQPIWDDVAPERHAPAR